MRLKRLVRSRTVAKVFLAYLIVIVVQGLVVITAAEVMMPIAFERYLGAVGSQADPALADELYANHTRAMAESILVAAAISTALAVGVSIYISRRMVGTVESMVSTTQRIADGQYSQRVPLRLSGAYPEDYDELQRLAVSLNQMAARLERSERLRTALIGDVAHELRTPLTTIRGYVEGLADGVLAPDAETLGKVDREVARLQRLVADLQELSRLEEGAFALDRRTLDLGQLLHSNVERLRPQFEAKGVTLVTDLPPDPLTTSGDSDRLSQVVGNLLGNALQYTPESRSVMLRASRSGHMARVEVIDEGIGISSAHLPHLFERFYRVDPSRSRVGGGTGIGLTIAKRLVEAHGGAISAASAGLGQGSTFTLTLPLLH